MNQQSPVHTTRSPRDAAGTAAPRMLRLLAISGSLRATSSNTALLRAVAALAPAQVAITLYAGLADLPHFNPDLDSDVPPAPIADFRRQLQAADGVLISSPEYAHGVPGALKNALDWVVGSGEFMDKPVALLNASSRATHAQASLTETLSMMMARLIPEGSVTLSLTTNRVTDAGLLADATVSSLLQAALGAFIQAVDAGAAAHAAD